MSCRDVITVNHLQDGVFEEGRRCVAGRRESESSSSAAVIY